MSEPSTVRLVPARAIEDSRPAVAHALVSAAVAAGGHILRLYVCND